MSTNLLSKSQTWTEEKFAFEEDQLYVSMTV